MVLRRHRSGSMSQAKASSPGARSTIKTGSGPHLSAESATGGQDGGSAPAGPWHWRDEASTMISNYAFKLSGAPDVRG